VVLTLEWPPFQSNSATTSRCQTSGNVFPFAIHINAYRVTAYNESPSTSIEGHYMTFNIHWRSCTWPSDSCSSSKFKDSCSSSKFKDCSTTFLPREHMRGQSMPAYFWTYSCRWMPLPQGAIQNVNIDTIKYWVSKHKLRDVAMARKATLQPII